MCYPPRRFFYGGDTFIKTLNIGLKKRGYKVLSFQINNSTMLTVFEGLLEKVNELIIHYVFLSVTASVISYSVAEDVIVLANVTYTTI